MPVRRKVFRIEQTGPLAAAHEALSVGNVSASECREILAELRVLQEAAGRHPPAADSGRDAERASALCRNTETLAGQIRSEVAALNTLIFGESAPSRITRELGAVFDGAERATRSILDAAEEIDDAAKSLCASLQRDQERALAQDIQDSILRIFEACNFQDLGGQRIAKVLASLRAIEEHIAGMMQICSGSTPTATATPSQPSRDVPLHGPRLDQDAGHLSQDEVDRMFAAR